MPFGRRGCFRLWINWLSLRKGGRMVRIDALWRSVGVPLLATLAIALVTLRTGMHGDPWWDWATGQWIWVHHRVPTVDPGWSWTRNGHVWFAHEWFLNLLLFLFAPQKQMVGIVLWSIVPGFGVAFVLWRWQHLRRPEGPAAWHAVWLMVSLLFLAAFYVHRPQDWAYLILVWWLYQLDRYRVEGRRTVGFWTLPLVMGLWANSHGSFFLGVGFVALHAVVAWRWPARLRDPPAWRWLGGLPVVSALSRLA